MDEIHVDSENMNGYVSKLIFDLLLDCVAANTTEPPADVREVNLNSTFCGIFVISPNKVSSTQFYFN